ncbi:hypothetical protein [Frankia sp. ArI3]|uniref:hypothetical protein n=1 Tax=Frankia sp. ArI3 TaxID=1858 RepID=UPI001C6FC784|nr:hypothetical protein [Frankia sp. ArI3]
MSSAAVEHRPAVEVQPAGQDSVAAAVHPPAVREPPAQATVGAALHLPVERTRLDPGGQRDAVVDAPGPAAVRPTGWAAAPAPLSTAPVTLRAADAREPSGAAIRTTAHAAASTMTRRNVTENQPAETPNPRIMPHASPVGISARRLPRARTDTSVSHGHPRADIYLKRPGESADFHLPDKLSSLKATVICR